MKITSINECLEIGFCVDGTGIDGAYAGDAEDAPFVVFNIMEQRNYPGTYPTRSEAEVAMLAIVNGHIEEAKSASTKNLGLQHSWIMFSSGPIPAPLSGYIVTLEKWGDIPKVEYVGTRPYDFVEDGYLAWWPIPCATFARVGFLPDGSKIEKELETKSVLVENPANPEIDRLKAQLKAANQRIEEQDAQLNKFSSQIIKLGFEIKALKN